MHTVFKRLYILYAYLKVKGITQRHLYVFEYVLMCTCSAGVRSIIMPNVNKQAKFKSFPVRK